MSKTFVCAPIPEAMTCSIGPRYPRSQNDHVRGLDSGRAAEQLALSPADPLQEVRARLGRQATGDLAHGRQQRPAAVRGLHRLIGQTGGPTLDQTLGEVPVGRQVEKREQDVARLEQEILSPKRLLDLDDELSLGEQCLSVGDDAGAGRHVGLVGKERSLSGSLLDQDLVASAGQLLGSGRGEGYPVLFFFDLCGYSDAHLSRSSGSACHTGTQDPFGEEQRRQRLGIRGLLQVVKQFCQRVTYHEDVFVVVGFARHARQPTGQEGVQPFVGKPGRGEEGSKKGPFALPPLLPPRAIRACAAARGSSSGSRAPAGSSRR